MDYACTYCPVRRAIEERGWALTDRLFILAGELLKVIGKDHYAFITLRQECLATRQAFFESHLSLRDHRHVHGC